MNAGSRIGSVQCAGLVAALAILASGAPCAASHDSSPPVTVATVVEQGKEAAVSVKDYTVEEYNELKDKAQARILKIQKRIEELGQKAESNSAEGREAAKREIEVLEGKLKTAKAKLKKFVKAGVKGSKDLWAGLGEAVDDLEAAAEKAWDRFGK